MDVIKEKIFFIYYKFGRKSEVGSPKFVYFQKAENRCYLEQFKKNKVKTGLDGILFFLRYIHPLTLSHRVN